MESLTLQPIARVEGTVNLPGSKSVSNRALLLAALARGTTVLTNLLDSDDVRHMLNALSALGVQYTLSADRTRCEVIGNGGPLRSAAALELFLGNAGTAMRPLAAALCLGSNDIVLTGEPRMKERPIGHLVDALRQGGAQIDYLEPVKPFTTYTGELGEYYRNVFSLLNTGFQQRPYARFVAIPSFSPEYAMSVEKKNGRCLLIANTLSRTYWQAEKGTVKVETKSVEISQSLYQSLGAIARLVTSQIQDLDGSTAGLDGVVYYFSSTDAKGKEMMGRKWSPMKGTLMERLVLVCQSTYMFSQGENISEQALAEEATALLKELEHRTKEQPDAHKKPMYVGIYSVGPKLKTHSGKQIEELPCLADVCVREYVARQMIYPVELLKDNVSGYALCEFTIDKEGVILRPHILKSTHPEFAEEALRIVKEMPNWTPALVGGKAVESDYTLYVPFRPQLYKEQLQIRERELSKKH